MAASLTAMVIHEGEAESFELERLEGDPKRGEWKIHDFESGLEESLQPKGRVRLTDLMNFRKSSKRLLTPPRPSFSESYIALFATKL